MADDTSGNTKVQLRTTRADRRLLSKYFKDPEIVRYLENLAFDITQGIPDAVDNNSDDASSAQIIAESAQSSASAAMNAVSALADVVASLDIPSPVLTRMLAASMLSLEGQLADVAAGSASSAAVGALCRRINDLEAMLLDVKQPIPTNTLPSVDPFTAPTLLNSWVNNVSGFNVAGYYKDPFGIVHLRGVVTSGVMGSAIFTLPAGYRPAAQELFAIVSNNLFGTMNVSTAGNVFATVGSNTFVSLDGLTFRAV